MAKPPSMKETMHQSLIEHGFSEEEAVRMTTRCCCNAAQVARLEGEKAAKDAALREMLTAVEQLGIFPDGIVARNARAALSDTGEGKDTKPRFVCNCDCHYVSEACCPDCTKRRQEGWLPPEVREQVLRTGRALLDWIGRSPLEPFEGDRVLHSMGLEEDFRAALDALEVK